MKSFRQYLTEADMDIDTFNYWDADPLKSKKGASGRQRLLNFIAKIEDNKSGWSTTSTGKRLPGSFSKKFKTKDGAVIVHPGFAQDLRKALPPANADALAAVFKRFDGRGVRVPLEYKEKRKLVSLDNLIARTESEELSIDKWTMRLSSFTKTDWDFGGNMAASAATVGSAGGIMSATASFDSTKFEGNICYGCTRRWAEKKNQWGIKPLDGKKGTKHEKAFEILNKNNAFNGTTIETKDINYNVPAMEAGYQLAKSFNIAKKTSLQTQAHALDSVYTKYGASSDKPKTDIIVGDKAVSVKKQGSAQLATPSSGEAAAIFHYACENNPSEDFNPEEISSLMYKVLSKEGFSEGRKKMGGNLEATDFDHLITKILQGKLNKDELEAANDNLKGAIGREFQDKIASEMDSMEAKFKKGIRESTVQASLIQNDDLDPKIHDEIFNHLKDKTTYYKNKTERTMKKHSKVGNLPKSAFVAFFTSHVDEAGKKKSSTAKTVVVDYAKEPIVATIKEAVKNVWLMRMPEINKTIMDYLSDPALHEYMMWEMATGYHKFSGTPASATDILSWTEDGTGTYRSIGEPHGSYAQKLAKCLDWNIGGGRHTPKKDKEGNMMKKGSIRLTIGTACFKEEVLSCNEKAFGNDFMNLNEEENKWCDDFGEAYADEYMKQLFETYTDQELLEGWLGDIGKGLSNMGKKAVAWGKQVLADWKEMIKSTLKWLATSIGKIVNMVKKAFASSTLDAMRMFGIGHTVSMQIK